MKENITLIDSSVLHSMLDLANKNINSHSTDNLSNKLINVNNSIAKFSQYPAKQLPSPVQSNRFTETRCEKKEADELFSCVVEFKKYQGSKLKTGGIQYIPIEIDNEKHLIPATSVKLPSKRHIYVGVIGNQYVVFYGKSYHIDNLVTVSPSGLWSSVLIFASTLLPFYQDFHCVPCSFAEPVKQPPSPPQRTGLGSWVVERAGIHFAQPCQTDNPGWRRHWQNALRWLGNIRDPWKFPAADAQSANASLPRQAGLAYAASAEFIAHLDPSSAAEGEMLDPDPNYSTHIDTEALTPATNLVSSTASPHIHTGAITPATNLVSSTASPHTHTGAITPATYPVSNTEILPNALLFFIDNLETRFTLPNKGAEELMTQLRQEFALVKNDNSKPIYTLLNFDTFMGMKVVDIFHKGLYFRDDDYALNIIIFKKIIEDAIKKHRENPDTQAATIARIETYSRYQILLSDYIVDIYKQLTSARDAIDEDLFFEVLEVQRYKSFEDGIEYMEDRIKDTEITDFVSKNHLKNILFMLSIMHEAHIEFSKELTVDDSPTIERIIYINNQKIYKSLVFMDNNELKKLLIKLRFYFIFEYTRNNGISVHSTNFLLPGELTHHWHLFAADEEELDHKKTEDFLIHEINNYLHQNHEDHSTMDQLNSIIELSRLNNEPLYINEPWDKRSIMPFDSTHQILQAIIKSHDEGESKPTVLPVWYKNLLTTLQNEKKLFVLLIYVHHLQELFIDNIHTLKNNNITFVSSTNLQHIFSAKIAAMRLFSEDYRYAELSDSLLSDYEDQVKSGNMDIYVKAAIIWFFSVNKNINDEILSRLNALDVLKEFIYAQKMVNAELSLRNQPNFFSVYNLKSSREVLSRDDYFQQFIEYKLHDSFFEAIGKTMLALRRMPLAQVDLIYPPKEICTFKIFSRNFVENSLSSFTSHSHPYQNIGYLTLLKTRTDKFYLLSTLSGFTFLNEISHLLQTHLVKKLMHQWHETETHLDLRYRKHINVTENEIMAFFFKDNLPTDLNTRLLTLLLKRPENDTAHKLISAYEFSPIKSQDMLSIVESYSIDLLESTLPLDLNTPLINSIDFLNQATLIEISDQLKDSLLQYTWLEHIFNLIPFFENLSRHWHDEEHKIQFHEIIFDLFDLITSLFITAARIINLTELTMENIIKKAITLNIPRSKMTEFILKELFIEAPELGFESLKIGVQEFASFVIPIPITEVLFATIKKNNHKRMMESIVTINNAIKKDIINKKQLRGLWKVDIKDKTFGNKDGILIDENNDKHSYIKNDNDYFKVFKDKEINKWRIANTKMGNDKNFAIPIMRADSGNWVAAKADFLSYHNSLFNFMHTYREQLMNPIAILSEPLVSIYMDSPKAKKTIAFYKKILRFYLYKSDFVRDLIKGTVSREHFLEKFNWRFALHKEIFDLIDHNPSSIDKSFLLNTLEALRYGQEETIRFRAITTWADAYDLLPKTYFAITIDIANHKFVIDLREVRGDLKINDKRDVFTHNEWIMMYRHNLALDQELIKYRDFELIEDAKHFPFREAISPSNYIQDGHLLREPLWYKPLLVKKLNNRNKAKFQVKNLEIKSYRSAMRSMRYNKKQFEIKELYPLHILYKCGKIDQEILKITTFLIKHAKIDPENSNSALKDIVRLTSSDDLLKVNEGKLVAFYGVNHHLEHLILSLGNGKFTGVKNTYFDESLPERASIVIAEQLGEFASGYLTLHHKEQQLIVLTGNLFGSIDTTPVLMPTLPQESIPIYKSDGKILDYRQQTIPRERMLLGDDCSVDGINDLQNRIRIKLHGAPFNVNHMDAIEFSDIIRGLSYIKEIPFNLNVVTSIELFSCYSGYGGRYSTAQILADELGIEVKAFPHKISDDIRIRRPEWFKIFKPIEENAAKMDSLSRRYGSPSSKLAQKIHRTFHDVWRSLRDITNALKLSRKKREQMNIPPIYIDLLHIIIFQEPKNSSDVGGITLCDASQVLFNQVLTGYGITEISEPEIIEQTFLDIILSINELRYLSDWFTAISPPTQENDAAPGSAIAGRIG